MRTALQRLLTTQSCQKGYFDKWRCELKFSNGDHIFLKVSPKSGMKHFGMRWKLSSLYIRPFKVLDRISPVAYLVALPRCWQEYTCVLRVTTPRVICSQVARVFELWRVSDQHASSPNKKQHCETALFPMSKCCGATMSASYVGSRGHYVGALFSPIWRILW